MKKILSVCFALAVFLSSVPASAGTDLSTAFSIMSWNIPAGTDVAGMGNVWAATPEFSSGNPAVSAMGEAGMMIMGGSLSYSQIGFSEGPSLKTVSGSIGSEFADGVLQITVARSSSSHYSDSILYEEEGGAEESYQLKSANSFDIQYGVRLTATNIYLGAGLGYSDSELEISWLENIASVAEGYIIQSHSKNYTATLGAAYQPNKQFTLGAAYTHSWDQTADQDSFNETSESDSSVSGRLRAGFGWQAREKTFLAADLQYLHLDSESKWQIFAGLEQNIIPDLLYGYAGWAGDAPTVGLGMYFEFGGIYTGGVNLAYVYHSFKELDEYFGKSSLLSLSGYLSY